MDKFTIVGKFPKVVSLVDRLSFRQVTFWVDCDAVTQLTCPIRLIGEFILENLCHVNRVLASENVLGRPYDSLVDSAVHKKRGSPC